MDDHADDDLDEHEAAEEDERRDKTASVCVLVHARVGVTGVRVSVDVHRYSDSSTRSIVTGSRGRSRASRSTPEMSSTTSCPSTTWPKTVCLPSSHEHSSAVTMKNCEPFVFGPALAIASAPRTTLCSLNSSSNW